ncbi:MAG: glycosyltransferase family 2 protein [Chloroflexota bacterium]|nr:glycosyltransferase family 2 protein [Chloroflexota bacterium]
MIPECTGDGSRVTVIMPTYNHGSFIERAIDSLLAQSFRAWRLIIVDDGSPDETSSIIAPYLADRRIEHLRLPVNGGLGAALNIGLEHARGEFVSYLPSDDIYHADHLETLVACLDRSQETVLAFAGARYHYNRVTAGRIPGEPLQLVQVLHRRSSERWVERHELVTDDLNLMFWDRLGERGAFAETGKDTCEWVDHPGQLHKLIREPRGGINPYRDTFGVQTPMRFHSSVGNAIDEVSRYQQYRDRPPTPMSTAGLKILLVGELAYNADRVLALEERGHRLYGLWSPAQDIDWYNTVGPMPFGHVEDLSRNGWEDAVKRLQPDVIYALLNWQAVPFAHHVLTANPGIPFIWHFKEGPFICLEQGMWPQLVELTQRADGLVFSSVEMGDWFATVVPGARDQRTLVLDGDLPKRDWFAGTRAGRISSRDGEIHTVVTGRPIGLHPETVAELAAHGIHLHFYGDYTHGQWRGWIDRTHSLAPGYLHLHRHVDQDQWVTEFSQYDAGWLHTFRSTNRGDIRRANWDDLNLPARLATLAAAGLPMIQGANPGAIVATQNLSVQKELGPLFTSIDELAAQLGDERRMAGYRDNVWRQREDFTFDSHANALVDFFRDVIAR